MSCLLMARARSFVRAHNSTCVAKQRQFCHQRSHKRQTARANRRRRLNLAIVQVVSTPTKISGSRWRRTELGPRRRLAPSWSIVTQIFSTGNFCNFLRANQVLISIKFVWRQSSAHFSWMLPKFSLNQTKFGTLTRTLAVLIDENFNGRTTGAERDKPHSRPKWSIRRHTLGQHFQNVDDDGRDQFDGVGEKLPRVLGFN